MAISRFFGIRSFVLAIAALVAALVLIVGVPLAYAEETGSCGADGDDVKYVLSDDGKLTISGEGAIADGAFEGREDVTQVVIEEGVTHIGDGAFAGCESLVGANLPQGLESIGAEAFVWCTAMEAIDIPADVASIGEVAFAGCMALKSISLPESLTTISPYAFAECARLSSVSIPANVTVIGEGAFSECLSLESVNIPAGVTDIGAYAFAACISLQSIVIPASVTSIGEDAFICCPSATISVDSVNSVYDSRDGCNALIETATNTLIAGTAYSSIPDTVTAIGSGAFAEPSRIEEWLQEIGLEGIAYQRLTGIQIPDSVTSIGSGAFRDCASLTALAIPASVTRIGSGAFSGTTAAIDYAGSQAQWAAIAGGESGAEPASYGAFDVVFDANGGSEVAAQYVRSGETATEPDLAPTKEWCTFQGWYADESLETPFDFSAPITQDTTIYAKWLESCVVTFDSRGGSAVETQHVMPGGKATEPNPAPTKDWAEFIGWFADEDLETEFDFENTTIEANTTIYAKWREQCAITFETNGGSAVETQHVWPNEKATKPVDDPTKDDCLFGGWYADAGLETPFDFDAEIAQDTTVYAKWITRCTVTFQTNGGTAVDAQLVWPGEKATEPDSAPTKEDCRFGGWYADVDCTTPFDFGVSITQNTTIYAKWITQCSVTFDSCGGSAVDAQLVWPGDLAVEPNPAPTKESREFAGWYTSKDYETAFDFANTAIEGDITLYAKWRIDSEDGAAYAKFDSGTGTLTFFRSRDEYATMQKKTYTDGEGNEQTITYYADIETTDWPASTSGNPLWENEYRTLTRVVFEDEIVPISTAMWFYGEPYLTSVEGMENLDTSNVTNMIGMFYGCSRLSELDVSHMDVSNVKRFDSMFTSCQALTELDVSGFDTSQAESLAQMFASCNALTELDVSGFNTSKVTNMSHMFRACMHLTELDVTGFDTSKVENMAAMFAYCEKLGSLDVSGFDTSHVTNMQGTFQSCSALTSLNLSGWDTSNVTTMDNMFSGCSSFTSLDLTNFDTSNVESMQRMFHWCYGLTSLDVSNFKTSKVTKMSGMFYDCAGLLTLDLSDLDVSKVKDFSEMFGYCHALTSLDLTGWDTSNAETMGGMFESCENLVSVDMSNLDTSHVTNFNLLFKKCTSLSNLNLSGLDTSSAKGMRYMFDECSSLTSLDLSGFKTSNVTDMQYMFHGCSSLAALDLSGWDTSNVTTMTNMFNGCSNLPALDVSGFVTSNVTDMLGMFDGCTGLASLDLSKFDTSKVEESYGMFSSCGSLKAIKLGEKAKVPSNTNLPVREWQLASLSELPVRYNTLDGYDGANPGWYLQGYADLAIEGLADAVYTGEPITQTLTIAVGERALEEDVDCTVSYADNTNAGTATVTIAGMGDWVGSTTRTFEITPKPIQPTLTLSQTVFTYNGSRQTPDVTVRNGEVEMDADEDYEVAFPDGCQEVGTYPVNVTLKGNYSGSASSTFEIVTNETVPVVSLSPSVFTYNGNVQVPEVVVKDADGVLIAPEDYDIIPPDSSKDVGTYTVRVTLKSGYSGEGSATFEIAAKAIEPTIVLVPEVFTYDGAVKAPEVTVWDDEDELVEGVDYDVAIPDGCKDVGSYAVEVALKGNYSGSAEAAFEIVPIAIEPRVTLSPAAFTYDGTAKVPKVEVWDGESVLVEGTDYDVALPDGRKNVGTYTVTVALKGIYAGSANATFEITAKETTPTVVLSPAKYTYNGAVKTPKVTVKDGADVLVAGEDYDITLPGGRKDAGTYKVKAVLKGNYSGSGSANITIAKAANTLVAKGKTVKVSASKLKSKSVKLTRKKTMKISKAKGTLSYKLGGVSKKKFKKYFKVNAKNGAITVKKNLKKGTYKVKVKVKAAGTKNYKAKTKTVTVTVRVK